MKKKKVLEENKIHDILISPIKNKNKIQLFVDILGFNYIKCSTLTRVV